MMQQMKSLPDLVGDYDVSPEQIAQFQRDGHIRLPRVVSPEELAAYRAYFHEYVWAHNTENRSLEERDAYGKAFIRVINLWHDEQLRKFILARRFGKLMADLMGVDCVALYRDLALFKESGGGPTPWHQDNVYWPTEGNSMATLWLPLDDLIEGQSAMSFVSGSHRSGRIEDVLISDESGDFYQQYIDREGLEAVQYGPTQAGDATVHHSWVIHSALPNTSNLSREVITIAYAGDDVRVAQPTNEALQLDKDTFLPDVNPGELVRGKLNPVVYDRREDATLAEP